MPQLFYYFSDRVVLRPTVPILPPSARLIAHAAAALLTALALLNGLAVTRDRTWPVGADTFRDIGAAETIRQSISRSFRNGVLLPDPYYKGEVFWYSPLMPALMALTAEITDKPMHVAATRGAVFWNLAAPIAFYMMVATLFDPFVGLAALGVFLFVEPFSAWQAATYSPYLIASTFAQTFFYLALLTWVLHRRQPGWHASALAGMLLGLSSLSHPAPTAVLAILFSIDTIVWIHECRGTPRVYSVAWWSGLAAGVGLLVAVPGLASPVHYHFRILEPLPFLWLDPSMYPEQLWSFLVTNVTAYLFAGPALVGVVSLAAASPSAARRLLFTWTGISIALFVWAGYAWRFIPWERLTTLTISPAHHFLIYARAAECIFAGIGAVALARLVTRRVRVLGEQTVTVALTAALVLASVSQYRDRDQDMLVGPTFSDEQLKMIGWIKENTTPSNVFLAPENTGISMIGLVGRRTVIVDRFFSNPYVDWYRRDSERQAMWASLSSENCFEFVRRADPMGVSHLLLVAGMTPSIPEGTCGFQKTVELGPFAIYSRISH